MPTDPNQRKPVILLAFANDLARGGQYLRQLSEEARRIRATLEPTGLERAGDQPYQVVIRQNATVADLFDAFRAHRDRIALFHFGGHANGYELYFENTQGRPAAAQAEGLAAFLGRQRGLRLVFLNGCSTQEQARNLLAANIDVVIATARDVEDEVALHFADQFYQGLTSGATLATAFQEAEAAAQLIAGAHYGRRHLGPQESADVSAAPQAGPGRSLCVQVMKLSYSGGWWTTSQIPLHRRQMPKRLPRTPHRHQPYPTSLILTVGWKPLKRNMPPTISVARRWWRSCWRNSRPPTLLPWWGHRGRASRHWCAPGWSPHYAKANWQEAATGRW
ncbi:MAG: CHAT domain-containing protein [Caldilineaceae bacterium]